MIKSKEHLQCLIKEAQISFDRDEWDSSLSESQALGLCVVDFIANYYLDSSGDLLDAVVKLTNDRIKIEMDSALYSMIMTQLLC